MFNHPRIAVRASGGNPQLLPYYEPEAAAAADDSEMACKAEPAVGPPVLMRFTNELLFEIFGWLPDGTVCEGDHHGNRSVPAGLCGADAPLGATQTSIRTTQCRPVPAQCPTSCASFARCYIFFFFFLSFFLPPWFGAIYLVHCYLRVATHVQTGR